MVAKTHVLMAGSPQRRRTPFLFEPMTAEREALDQLDLTFEWGNYRIHVRHFHLKSFEPGEWVKEHAHTEYEFHFIPYGFGEVIMANERFALHPGLLYLTGPGVLHRQAADAHQPMHELCLHIDIEDQAERNPERPSIPYWELREAEECLTRLAQLPARPTGDRGNAMHWFLVAYRAWQDNQLGLYTTIKHSIIQILLRTVHAYASAQQSPHVGTPSVSAEHCQLALQYIHDHYARPLTLSEVAGAVGIGPRHLQRVLREHVGSSFTAYLEQHRLAQVCTELTHSLASVVQLAAMHGFASNSHLHTTFKRRLGITPSEFRAVNSVMPRGNMREDTVHAVNKQPDATC